MTTTYLNKDFGSLAMQLVATPVRRVWLDVVLRMRSLLADIDTEKAYPFEFVWFRLTEKKLAGELRDAQIPGCALVGDLVTLAEELSRKAGMTAEELGEAFVTHDDLAAELSVSTKTIRRWRARGLLGLRIICPDAVGRVVFPRSSVTIFIDRHADMVRRGSSFRQLTDAERDTIVGRAREILSQQRVRMHTVAKMISEETGRAVETIRYTLRRFEDATENESLFEEKLSQQAMDDLAIAERLAGGESLAAVAAQFELTQAQVTRSLIRVRVQEWQKTPPAYMYNELFDAPNAEEMILHTAEPKADADNATDSVRVPRDLPSYLKSLYRIPLLSFEQEQDIFRRYNYVKYRAAKAIASLDADTVTESEIATIEAALDQADAYRQRIVRANLRLVVSVARRHVGVTQNFFEVVSDGNVSLMRAAEKFDYARGFKFSTYASWAIMKNFARSIPEEHYHTRRYMTGQEEVLDAASGATNVQAPDHDREKLREQIAGALSALDDREREIVTSHFGLFGQGEPLTLEQLGQRFGVTKERVRQIEQRALGRLRESLGANLVAALT